MEFRHRCSLFCHWFPLLELLKRVPNSSCSCVALVVLAQMVSNVSALLREGTLILKVCYIMFQYYKNTQKQHIFSKFVNEKHIVQLIDSTDKDVHLRCHLQGLFLSCSRYLRRNFPKRVRRQFVACGNNVFCRWKLSSA